MAAETQSTIPASEFTIISRVTSIPLIYDSLSAVHSSLSTNPFTRSPYTTAQALSSNAMRYTEPLANRLAPLLIRADDLANHGLDVVEARYPYPFKTPTVEIINNIKERGDQVKDVANKTLEERVRTPAYSVAQGIDQVHSFLLCFPIFSEF